jgi:hypothetical protein
MGSTSVAARRVSADVLIELVRQLYRSVGDKLGNRKPSAENWRWKPQIRIQDRNKSPEVVLESYHQGGRGVQVGITEYLPRSCWSGGSKMRTQFALVLLLVTGACAQQQQATLASSMNAAEMAWARGEGANTVTGFAILRTVGGEARTCAGLTAQLIPDSVYARERMAAIFGNTVKGTRASNRGAVKFTTSGDPLYLSLVRTTRCDGQGAFTFERVPDGVWYVTTSVTWKSDPTSPLNEGGSMMQRVELRGGQTTRVTLP